MGFLESLIALLGIGGVSALVWWVRSQLAHAEAKGELRERHRWSSALADRQDELGRQDAEAFAAHAHRVLEIRQDAERLMLDPTKSEVKRFLERSKGRHRPIEVNVDDM